MSNVIDKRILEMVADTSQFDSKLDASCAALDRIEKKLDSLGSSGKDPFSSLEKSLKTLSSGGLFQSIEKHLSNLDFRTNAIGKEFQRYKDQAVHAISSVGSELLGLTTTLGQVQNGFKKFEEKTQNVATLISQGYDIETVNKQLERLNTYTDETSYNFTDMVNNIGKFTATGQSLEDSVTAMMGIANWAALSGQSAQKASQAMYQLSQAIGKGALRYDDWRSVQNAGMDTKEFRQMAVDIGVASGKLKEVEKGIYTITSDAKKARFTLAELFSSDALTRKNWFDSKLMMDTFNKYSSAINDILDYAAKKKVSVSEAIEAMGDSVDAFGLKAFRAAQEARSWTDVMDSLKDAVSTSWMKTFELIFGNYEEAKVLFSNLANNLWELVMIIGNWRNALFKSWRDDGGREAFFDGIVGGVNSVISVLHPLSEAWKDAFSGEGENFLTRFSKGFRDLTESLMLTEDQMTSLYKGAKTVFVILRETLDFIKSGIKDDILSGSVFDKLIEKLNAFKDKCQSLSGPIDFLITRLTNLKSFISGVTAAFKSGDNVWSSLFKAMSYAVGAIGDAVGKFDLESLIFQTKDGQKELTTFGKILGTVSKILGTAFNAAIVIGRLALFAFGAAVASIAAIVHNNLPRIVDWFSKLPDKITAAKKAIQEFYAGLKESSKSSAYMSGVIKAFEQLFKTIKDIGQKTLDGIFDSFQKLMSGKLKMPSLQDLIDGLKELGRILIDFVDKIDDVKQAIMGGIKTPLSYLIDTIKSTFEKADALASPFTRKKFFGEGGGNAKKGEALGYIESISESLGIASNRADTASRSLDMVRASAAGATQEMGSLGTVISTWFTNLTKVDGIIGFIARSINELITVAGGVNWNSIFAFAAIGAYVLMLIKLAGAVKGLGGTVEKVGKKIEESVGKVTDGISSHLKGMFDSFGKITTVYDAIAGYFKTLGKTKKYSNFKEVALGILMLAGALAILAFVPVDRLKDAGIALAGLAVGLTVVAGALAGFSKIANPIALFGLAAAFVGFSVGLLTMASTLRSVVQLIKDGGDISGAFGIIIRMLAGLLIIAHLLAVIGPLSVKSSLSLILFAVALSSFFSVLKRLVTDTAVLEAFKKAIKSFFDFMWKMANDEPWKAILGVGSLGLGILTFVGAIFLASQMAVGAGKNMFFFAASLGVMYYAIKLFSTLPFDQAVDAMGSLVIAAVMLSAFVFIFNKMTGMQDTIQGLGKTVVKLAIALLILTGALAIITNLKNFDKIGWGIVYLGAMLLTLATAVAMMGKAKPEKVAAALIGMVVSLYLLLPILLLLSVLPWQMVAKGMGALAVGLVAMGVAVKLMGGAKIPSLIVGFVAMAGSLIALVLALSALSKIDAKTLLAAAGSISMIVLTFGAIASDLTKAKAACFALAASMVILSLAIPIICNGFKMLEGINWSTIVAAAGGIAGLAVALGLISKFVAGTKGIIGTMFSLAGAMVVLGLAAIPFGIGFKMLAGVDWLTILVASVAIAALAAALTTFGSMAAVIPGAAVNMLALAGAMLILGAAVAVFAFGIRMLEGVEDIAKGAAIALGVLLVVAALVAAFVPGAGVAMLAFGASLIAFGVSAVLFGVACVAVAFAFNIITVAISNLLPALTEFVNQTSAWDIVGTAIGMGLLAVAFLALGVGCAILAGGLGLLNLAFDGAKEMIDWFVEGTKQLSEDIKAVAESIGTFVDDILAKIEEFKNSDIVKGISDVIDGITQKIEELKNFDPKAFWDNLWSGFGESAVGKEGEIGDIVAASVANGAQSGVQEAANNVDTQPIGDAISRQMAKDADVAGEKAVGEIANAISAQDQLVYASMYQLADYGAQGFYDSSMNDIAMYQSLGNAIMAAFQGGAAGTMQVNSPSKWMAWLANMCASGFLQEIANKMAEAEASGAGWGESFQIGLEGILQHLPEIAESCGGSFLDTLQSIFSQLPNIGEVSISDFISSLTGHNGDLLSAAQAVCDAFGLPLDGGITSIFNLEEGRFAEFIQQIMAMIANIDTVVSSAEIKLRAKADRMNAIAKANRGVGKNIEISDAGTTREKKYDPSSAGFWDNLLGGNDILGDVEAAAASAADGIDGLGGSFDGLGGSAGGAGGAVGDATEKIKTFEKYTKYASQTADTYAKSFGSMYAVIGNTDPMEHAQAAIDELAEAIYQDSLEASGAVEDASMSAEDRAQAVKEAFNEAFEDIKKDVEESIDFFNEFSQTIEDMTPPEKILSNAESHLKGLTSLGEKYVALAKKGFSQEVIGEIEKEGVSALGKVNSLLLFSIDQVEAYNQNYINKTVLSSAVASQAMAARAIAIQKKHLEASAAAGDALAQEALNLIEINAKASDTVMKFQVRYETMHDTVKEAIESQMDLFSKLELKTETTADEMLNNMRSQINGIAQWAAECETLAARGIDDGLLAKLESLGPEGYEKLHAFASMSDEQLQEANNLYQQSLILPESAANRVATSYAMAGMAAGENYATALQQFMITNTAFETALGGWSVELMESVKAQLAAIAPEAGLDAVTKYAGAISANAETAETAGTELGSGSVQAIIAGINEQAGPLADEARTAAEGAYGAINETINPDKGHEQGYYYGSAIASGIRASIDEITAAAAEASQATIITTATELKEKSPSKVGYKMGMFWDMGLANGISQNADLIASNAGLIAESAVDSMTNALQTAKGIIEGSSLAAPTITPVMDLSQIQNGVGAMDGMLSGSTIIGASPFNVASPVSPFAQLAGLIGKPGNTTNMGGFNITINTQPGMDPNDIANAVSQEIYRALMSREAVAM